MNYMPMTVVRLGKWRYRLLMAVFILPGASFPLVLLILSYWHP